MAFRRQPPPCFLFRQLDSAEDLGISLVRFKNARLVRERTSQPHRSHPLGRRARRPDPAGTGHRARARPLPGTGPGPDGTRCADQMNLPTSESASSVPESASSVPDPADRSAPESSSSARHRSRRLRPRSGPRRTQPGRHSRPVRQQRPDRSAHPDIAELVGLDRRPLAGGPGRAGTNHQADTCTPEGPFEMANIAPCVLTLRAGETSKRSERTTLDSETPRSSAHTETSSCKHRDVYKAFLHQST